MTRYITVVNTSNWPGEDCHVALSNSNEVRLAPGEMTQAAVPHDRVGVLNVTPLGEGKGGYKPHHVVVHPGEKPAEGTMMIVAYGPDGECLAKVHPMKDSEAFRRCGVSFNPSQDVRVSKIKALSAALMQAIDDEMMALDQDDGDGKRCMATAKTHLESAQMFAVKGCFMAEK